MLYQLAKTSVGLTGQVKWNLILNNNKVLDFQLTPIHESINFNYTKREDTLNYTHVQNLNRLYKKIPHSFFETVVKPELNTGYPVRNQGTRIDTHENTYEMGMKRISCSRYGKQFAFFCPVWCDSKDEINNIEFHVVAKNAFGTKVSERTIDHSLIKDYISQFVDEIDLNGDLAYIDFKNFSSWIKGINVESGVIQTKNTSTVIDHMLQSERTILETDSSILNQFINNKIVCGQLFNFNFIFDIDDIIPPQMMSDFIGGVINVYVDVYYKGSKVPEKDIYSNYEFIPKYDISTDSYQRINCLDYIKDYNSIENITKNKLVQTVFHWSLSDNPKYLFNMYDGCCPVYTIKDDNGKEKKYSCSGMYFDSPDLSSDEWNPMKNQLAWCKPYSLDPGLIEFEIADKVNSLFEDMDNEHWVHYMKKSNDEENFWINNVLYNNDIKWDGNFVTWGSPILEYGKNNNITKSSPSLLDDVYFNVTFVPLNICNSISIMNECLKAEGFADICNGESLESNKIFFVSCIRRTDSVSDNEITKGTIVYVILGKTEGKSYFDKISFLVFLPEGKESYKYVPDSDFPYPMEYFIKDNTMRHLIKSWPWITVENELESKHYETVSNTDVHKANSLSLLTSRILVKDNTQQGVVKYNISQDVFMNGGSMELFNTTPYSNRGVYTYKENLWLPDGSTKDNVRLIYNLRSIVRTISENLGNIVDYNTIIFNNSIDGESSPKPQVLGKFNSNTLSELDFYNVDKFSYVFRYDGKLQPYFIDSTKNDPLIYNNTYVVKQYNQQINTLQWSDADMKQFNDYLSTKFSPLYPSLDYFSLRKRRCRYNQYHRGSRRYLGEKSWFKANQLYVMPHEIVLSYRGSSLNEDTIKSLFKSYINRYITYQVKGGDLKRKKNEIFNHFIYPLYNYEYKFDYIDKKTIDKYIYTIKYTLK